MASQRTQAARAIVSRSHGPEQITARVWPSPPNELRTKPGSFSVSSTACSGAELCLLSYLLRACVWGMWLHLGPNLTPRIIPIRVLSWVPGEPPPPLADGEFAEFHIPHACAAAYDVEPADARRLFLFPAPLAQPGLALCDGLFAGALANRTPLVVAPVKPPALHQKLARGLAITGEETIRPLRPPQGQLTLLLSRWRWLLRLPALHQGRAEKLGR